MRDTFARSTHSAGRPSAARDDRVSCIQGLPQFYNLPGFSHLAASGWLTIRSLSAFFLLSRNFICFVYNIPYRRAPRLACQPLGRVRRASKGILHTIICYAAASFSSFPTQIYCFKNGYFFG